MLLKLLKCVLSITLPIFLISQTASPKKYNLYRNEFSLVSDNDNYTLQGRDGYYTNGFFLKWSRAADLSKRKFYRARPAIRKVINGLEAGQIIYNPVSYNRPLPENQDRPFAAWLGLSFDRHIFKNKLNKTSMFMWGVSAGAIGPDSYGKQVQRWYHHVIGIYDVKGWSYQVNNDWTLNLKAAWYSSPFRTPTSDTGTSRPANLYLFLKANVGNLKTDASAGILFMAGKMEELFNSSHFRARLTAPGSASPGMGHELYFFYEPAVTYQVYNSLLQGPMLLSHKGPVTVALRRVVFAQQLGLRFARNRFTGALVYTHRSREAVGQIRSENFGSLQFAYRFRKINR